ncbi:response regulator transcription factor [Rhizobium bangladeshense]|uniref:response regulator transcription factor n=1 Tax=Rhizobium bangladeshense TaxID=1138189 RepID=UPI001A991360|nr:response regulator [Rhizobium bangladeshense]MBX4891153.1 response regulator transcription factor [Rhizobium bangladeshense]MBX4934727.1 response regulator transcription factor [Rhizobium bangladeshense]MBY3582761.1 response regulator transcription factor [Rhizobium bangladeshense]QSY91105.1 response regulator transcription factor [Rhizobium bangladeshense]
MVENGAGRSLICVIDDDVDVRDSLEMLLRSADYNVRSFAGPEEFLACDTVDAAECLILDINLGGANGLDFQEELRKNATTVPIILISGFGDVPMTVRGMKAGAITFLMKPFDEAAMLMAIDEALASNSARRQEMAVLASVQDRYESLTTRERQVFGLVTAGLMNKQMAGRLEISEITVKIHRGNMVKKMRADSVADLVRLAEVLGVREDATRYNRRLGQVAG